MLVGVKVIDELGDEFYMRVNPFHVVSITIANSKNPDAGSYLLFRTGEQIFSPDPIDIIDRRFNEVVNTFASQTMMQIINEYAVANKPKRGRPKKSNN
jgi:hypothetical protein